MTDTDTESPSPESGAAWMFQLTDRLRPLLMAPIYPLCTLDHPLRPLPLASALLVQVFTRRFLITAKHAYSEGVTKPLGIILPSGVHELTGTWAFTVDALPDLDMAVLSPNSLLSWHLQAADATPLRRLSTLPPSLESAAVKGSFFVVLGYPLRHQPQWLSGAEYPAKVWQLIAAEAPASDYAEVGASHEHHLLLDFIKDEVHTPAGAAVAPDPIGVSGGAVWWVRVTESGLDPRLVAMPVAWRKGSGHLRCTRIYCAVAAIGKSIPAWLPLLEQAD